MTTRRNASGAIAAVAGVVAVVVFLAYGDGLFSTEGSRAGASRSVPPVPAASPAATPPAPQVSPSQQAAPAPRVVSAPPVAPPPPEMRTVAYFTPPSPDKLPQGEFGKTVAMGRDIFEHTDRVAKQFVGNTMRCSSCHLDAGRLPNSAPLWGAYVSYPAYRSKTKSVTTFQERLQGCFRYSMNGKAPPLGDPVLVALESYSYWLASGATIDPKIKGRGYPKLEKPAQPADYVRGEKVFQQHCVLCHGADGAGQVAADGQTVFPALWGAKSFNWGAGMGSVQNAAGFIKANMPLGLGGTLSDQDAWDVAHFMDSHERPQDPRYTGSVAATRAKFHDSPNSMYGRTVNGHVLGDTGPPIGLPRVAAASAPGKRR